MLGTLRTVLFAPEDLALVKGDPSERRRFLDDLLVARQPRWAGVRGDYDKILKQRNALLKSAQPLLRKGSRRRPPSRPSDEPVDDARATALHTLDIWNDHLATVGSQLLYARLRLLRDLGPYLSKAYDEVSAGQSDARVSYKSSLREAAAASLAAGEVPEIDALRAELLATLEDSRDKEIERGISLAGPHRDDLVLSLGELPAKGYASHGESWSFALGLKLAAYQLLRHDLGEDPVLILDDVFAELDTGRRERLAAMVADCEQVLITAAVDADVPKSLVGQTFAVSLGEVTLRELTTRHPTPTTPASTSAPSRSWSRAANRHPATSPTPRTWSTTLQRLPLSAGEGGRPGEGPAPGPETHAPQADRRPVLRLEARPP